MIALLAGTAGCSTGGGGAAPPGIPGTASPPASTTASLPVPTTSTVASTSSWLPDPSMLAAVCNGAAHPQAPPAATVGPWPIAVARGGEPDPWTLDTALLGGAADLGAVQLVACVSVRVLGAQVRTCPYPGAGTFSLRSATYTVRLVEVATGREVRSGDQVGADQTCPATLRSVPNEKKLPTALTAADLAKALGPYAG